VWTHIYENAKTKNTYILKVNGYKDHCHCLVSMSRDQSIQKLMQMIKGESAFWINKNKLTANKFQWQEEYYAASVSESSLKKVKDYIQNQEEYHPANSFRKEYDELGFQ